MTRLDVFTKLLDKYQQTPEDYDAGEEEDPRPYFTGEAELARWCCVTANYTSHGEAKYFFLPTFDSAEIAQLRAVEYAEDNIFEELPVEVVNLDNGTAYEADWSSIGWKVGAPVLDGPADGAQCTR